MVDRERRKRILTLALPIIGGMISQNVLNLVDTGMVGVLGDNALAAVGIGSFTNFMAMAFITGMSTGVQAIAARRKGENRHRETAVPLNGGLLIVLCLALPASVLLYFLAPTIFSVLTGDAEVGALGTGYFQVRVLALIAVGMNFSFRGYWNAVDLSRLYLRTLLLMHVTNIFLNWVLIFGHLGMPALGTTGAGIGTSISTCLGTAYYFVLGMRHARGGGFLRGIPDRASLKLMLRLSVPSGIQQFFFAAGMTAFFWIVGRVGTAEVAASNVLINLLLVALLPGIGFGIAAASLVGQALGANDTAAAKAWGWDVVKIAAVVVGAISMPVIFVPKLALGAFLHDPATLEMATTPLRLLAGMMAFDTVGLVLMNALLGAGDSRRVMVISIVLQWFLFLPVAYCVGPGLGYGLVAIWAVHVGYRLLQTVAFVWSWCRGGWASIEV